MPVYATAKTGVTGANADAKALRTDAITEPRLVLTVVFDSVLRRCIVAGLQL